MDAEINKSKLIQNPAKYSQQISLESLTKFIQIAIENYENSEPIIPDHIYDTILDILKQRRAETELTSKGYVYLKKLYQKGCRKWVGCYS